MITRNQLVWRGCSRKAPALDCYFQGVGIAQPLRHHATNASVIHRCLAGKQLAQPACCRTTGPAPAPQAWPCLWQVAASVPAWHQQSGNADWSQRQRELHFRVKQMADTSLLARGDDHARQRSNAALYAAMFPHCRKARGGRQLFMHQSHQTLLADCRPQHPRSASPDGGHSGAIRAGAAQAGEETLNTFASSRLTTAARGSAPISPGLLSLAC